MNKILRQQIRKKRQALSEDHQVVAQRNVLEKLRKLPEMCCAENIAIYYSSETDGELRTSEIIKYLWSRHKNVYLPRVVPGCQGIMAFYSYTPYSVLIKNKYGLWEPDPEKERHAEVSDLDIIITPLVAFDKDNHRLGMGGGFYDRILAGWKEKQKPLPVGIAHSCQRVERIDVQEWDISLDRVIVG